MTNSIGPVPIAPVITNADLGRQFWLDAYGKEVQSAATYSYMWMADQAGHMGIGILLHFAFTPIFAHLPQALGLGDFFASPFMSELAGFITTALLVAYWEWSAYSSDVKRAEGAQFPLDVKLLRANAIVAATYMAMGGAIGWALHLRWQVSVPIIAGLAGIAVMLARPWLRQKIIWQKAALPYLSRLADIAPNMAPAAATALWEMVCAPLPPAGPPRALVMSGTPQSGRTATVCSIGTEFAFKAASVRYLSLSTLIELAEEGKLELPPQTPPGPSNVGYWPWSQAQVLIIDDIGPLAAYSQHSATKGPTLGLRDILDDCLGNVRDVLARRHTVWVIGTANNDDIADVEAAAAIIGGFLGIADPLPVLLSRSATPIKPRQAVRVPGSTAHVELRIGS
jgi:hypothetical protein